MGILDFLFGAQRVGPRDPFDPFDERQFDDPSSTPSQPILNAGGGLIGGGVGPTPMSFGPAPAGTSGGQGRGFLSNLFNPSDPVAIRNAQILEANRLRFEPGGALADVSAAQRANLLQSPRNARRLIEARQAEARLRSRPPTKFQQQQLGIRRQEFGLQENRFGLEQERVGFEEERLGIQTGAVERKRLAHEARVRTLDDPTGPFANMNEATKQGLRGSPTALLKAFNDGCH